MKGGLQGLSAWVVQRVTAVYLALFVLVALGVLLGGPREFAAWHSLVGHPAALLAIALFYMALLWHAWIGVRDVFVDYLHVFWIRLTAYVLLAAFLIGCGLWVARVLILATLS
jgi:succinate dehydrogenase / fumarate reductase membrane anchor subunit